jgi:hypothetical protein
MSQQLGLPTELDRRQLCGTRFLLGISVVSGLLAWLGVWLQMTYFIPRTENLMLAFHMRLPLLTAAILKHYWWVLPAVAIVALLFCLGIRKRWAWSFSLMVLPLLLNVLLLVSLYNSTLELAMGLQWLAANP